MRGIDETGEKRDRLVLPRAEVVRTRRIAVVVDEDLKAGVHAVFYKGIELSGPLHLRDALEAAQSRVGPEGTFNNFKAIPDETRRIDYVLADASLTVRSHAVLAWLIEGGRVASDHFPVVANLSSCRG